MKYSITSEDNWLVQSLFLASFSALVFFGTTSGWIAAQLGLMQSASAYTAVVTPAPVAPVLVYDTQTNPKETPKDNAAVADDKKAAADYKKDEVAKKTKQVKDNPAKAVTAKKAAGWVITTDRINVRQAPNGAVLVIKNPRERAQVVAGTLVVEAGHSWQQVEFADGVKGYVAAEYVTPEESAVAPTPTTDDQTLSTMEEVQKLQAQVADLQAQLENMQALIDVLMQ